jgi:hypothetical protein
MKAIENIILGCSLALYFGGAAVIFAAMILGAVGAL